MPLYEATGVAPPPVPMEARASGLGARCAACHVVNRRAVASLIRQVTAHRNALLVAAERRLSAVQVLIGVVPPAKKAHQHTRASRGVDLLALQGVPDGLSRVLCGPYSGVA